MDEDEAIATASKNIDITNKVLLGAAGAAAATAIAIASPSLISAGSSALFGMGVISSEQRLGDILSLAETKQTKMDMNKIQNLANSLSSSDMDKIESFIYDSGGGIDKFNSKMSTFTDDQKAFVFEQIAKSVLGK